MCDRRHMIAVVLAGALAAGCSEGTTEPPTTAEPLSAAEAMALFEGMSAIQLDSTSTIIGGSESSIVLACPLGGQVRVAGMPVDESVADTVRLVSDYTTTPEGCQFASGGLQFTVDGAPDVRQRTVLVMVGFLEHLSLEGTVAGRLDWQSDGRSGSCEIDLVLSGGPDLSATEPSLVAALSGTLCGHEAEIDVQDTQNIPGPSG